VEGSSRPEQSLVTGGASRVVAGHFRGFADRARSGNTHLVGDGCLSGHGGNKPDGTSQRLAVPGGFLQADHSPGARKAWPRGTAVARLSTKVPVLAGIAELATRSTCPGPKQAKEAATARVAELSPGGAIPTLPRVHPPDAALPDAETAAWPGRLRLSVASGSSTLNQRVDRKPARATGPSARGHATNRALQDSRVVPATSGSPVVGRIGRRRVGALASYSRGGATRSVLVATEWARSEPLVMPQRPSRPRARPSRVVTTPSSSTECH